MGSEPAGAYLGTIKEFVEDAMAHCRALYLMGFEFGPIALRLFPRLFHGTDRNMEATGDEPRVSVLNLIGRAQEG